MAHSMFCTDFVATVVYGGSAYAERGSVEDNRFDEGVRMGSMGLLLHSMTGKSLQTFFHLSYCCCEVSRVMKGFVTPQNISV